MKHTLEGLLNCARIAFPGYDWVYVNGVIRIKPKHSGKINTIDEFFDSVPKTFLLDNDSDVLALEDAVLMDERVTVMGHTTWLLDKPWHIEFTDRPEIQAATKTDCLYAAAMEVVE